jgi:hypothetical protein
LAKEYPFDTCYHWIFSPHLLFRALHSSRLAEQPDRISANQTSKKIEEQSMKREENTDRLLSGQWFRESKLQPHGGPSSTEARAGYHRVGRDNELAHTG